MLTIKAEGSAGAHLRDDLLVDMLALAQRTSCRVEVEANETTFIVSPDENVGELKAAFDRLYPESSLVMQNMPRPLLRASQAPTL